MKTVLILGVILAAVALGVLFMRRRAAFKVRDKPEFSDEQHDRYCEAKEAALERVLGPMHDIVGHAIISFQAGGAVDMYYFQAGIPGTGMATMELIETDGTGPKANRIGTFEFVAFTKQRMPPPGGESAEHAFNRIERRFCGIFTTMGNYSYDAVLNPRDTCEVPGKENEPNKCVIFDEYAPDGKPFEIAGKKHCLLLCIEVFRSEMEYAMENGGATLLEKLKEEGHYPYSDLDRESVY